MEVKLDKRYPLGVSASQAWRVLADIRTVASCMPGAAITEQVDETHYKGTVRSKVGPAVMSFQGDIEVLGMDVDRRELQMLGKGADRGGSSASMNLTAQIQDVEGGGSALVGMATVTVSGKLAQFGSRLLVPVSEAMLAQFAQNFEAAALALAPEAPAPAEGSAAAPTAASEASAPAPAPERPASPAQAVKELDALHLAWQVLKGWWAGLWRKKSD